MTVFKKSFIIIILSFITSTTLAQEVMIPDTITTTKTWIDKNGLNMLTIHVNAACNPDTLPHDGHQTMISAQLSNNLYKVKAVYDEPNYQMKMIYFDESDIWYYDINGVKAVFIPFDYCGNADDDMVVSFIILYNKQKYIYHINLKGEDFANYRLNDNLNKKLKKLPKELQPEFVRYLKAKY